MYCVNCGVKLEDTEKVCPLCNTEVYHPHIKQGNAPLTYPKNKLPKINSTSMAFNGILIFLFFIPMLISLIADIQTDGKITWFGFAAGAMVLCYIFFALPLWFKKPNPVIFVPCSFGAIAAYLLYINLATGGNWFLNFALPVTGGICLIVSTVITLLRYLKKGRLYIWGGALMGFGAFMILAEILMDNSFSLSFVGWSVYPLIVFVLLGAGLIYLAINKAAREIMERKLFF